MVDDPDERKQFDAGRPAQSRCTETDVPERQRCAGIPYVNTSIGYCVITTVLAELFKISI